MACTFKYPEFDSSNPLKVEPLTTAGPQPWHADADILRQGGMTVRAIARELKKGFGPVQRYLNPESKRRQKELQAEYERDRRKHSPTYAQKTRDYIRRYMQMQYGHVPEPPAGN